MKFVIGASNVKIFAKSILALSKIGDELYVEPLQNSVSCLILLLILILDFQNYLFRNYYSQVNVENGELLTLGIRLLLVQAVVFHFFREWTLFEKPPERPDPAQ